jgi:membrane protein
LPVLWWIVNIPGFIGFWWFTMWFLLDGRVSWRRLVPYAVATSAFWLGMYAVFSVIFRHGHQLRPEIRADRGRVQPRVVLHRIGVVLILGAAVGLMWQDRGLSFRAAVRKLRRAS